MPKFRNATTDDLVVPSLGGLIVESGSDTPDLTKEQAAGFADQAGVWEPVTAKSNPKETD